MDGNGFMIEWTAAELVKVRGHRELSAQRPDVFQHALASALNTLGLILNEAGLPVAALEATEKARAQDPFTKLESDKAELDTILFERNRESKFRIIELDFEGTRFFGDCTWPLAPNFNVLLSRNGYGKSCVLHAIAALLASDYRSMSDLFPASERQSLLSHWVLSRLG
jgi:hypothetical protein